MTYLTSSAGREQCQPQPKPSIAEFWRTIPSVLFLQRPIWRSCSPGRECSSPMLLGGKNVYTEPDIAAVHAPCTWAGIE
jgi:hypothetical protein